MARGRVAFPDDAQTFEGKVVVHLFDVARAGAEESGETSGGDDFAIRAHLREEAFEDCVDHAEISVVETGLHAADGVGADDAGGLANFDAGQAGGASEERFGGDADTWTDDAADVFAFGGDAVERGGGAEVDGDAGASVFFESGDGVDDAVGANFRRVVVEDGHAGFYAGLDEKGLRAEVALAHFAQSGIERGHDRGDDDALDIRDFQVRHRKQVAEQDTVFVDGFRLICAYAPVRDEDTVLVRRVGRRGGGLLVRRENSEHRVCVADVEN